MINQTYKTERMIIKMLGPEYSKEVLAFQNNNREEFQKYEPTRPDTFYTLGHQLALLRLEQKLALKRENIRFYCFLKENPSSIIGTVCLHDITGVPYLSTEVGYKFDHNYWGRGLAKEAVDFAVGYAFKELNLHKVFARVMKENVASVKLLEALDFAYEGTEIKSTIICDKWEDHMRYSLVNPND